MKPEHVLDASLDSKNAIGQVTRLLETAADMEAIDQKAFFKAVLDSIPEFIVCYDEDLNIVWANRSAAHDAGFKQNEIVGHPIFEATCKKEHPCSNCPIIKGFFSECTEKVENHLISGRLFYSRTYPVQLPFNSKKIRLSISQDISKQKNRYNISELQNFISETFHAEKELAIICDDLIRKTARTFDYPYGAVILYEEGTSQIATFGEIIYSDKTDATDQLRATSKLVLEQIHQSGDIVKLVGIKGKEHKTNVVPGESTIETVLAIPLIVQDGIIGAIVLIDFVERADSDMIMEGLRVIANRFGIEILRKQAEDQLMEERNFTSAVLNNAGPLIVVTDSEGHVIRINKSVERLLGTIDGKKTGEFFWDFRLVNEDKKRIQDLFPLSNNDMIPTTFETNMITRSGKSCLVSWSNSIMGTPRNKNVHLVFIGIDITKKRKIEEEAELRRSQLVSVDKMISLGILSSEIAHEINNPNNFIMLNTPLLRNTWQDAIVILNKYQSECGDFNIAGVPYSKMRVEINKLFDGIEEGSQRIQQIILNMKSFIKKDDLDMDQKVNMNQVVQAALGLMSGQLKKQARLDDVVLLTDLPLIKGNFQRMEQVVINLLQNACQSLPSNRHSISINTRYQMETNQVIISISDQGVGIPLENVDNIFDPFFTTKTESGGTGLGLSVCDTIVKEHEGKLIFTSEVGIGTIAELSLPAYS